MTLLGADFLLDADGDLDMTNGDVTLTPNVQQAIEKKLRFVKGEWFLNLEAGLPYYEDVLVKSPIVGHIEVLFREAILSVLGVKDILSMEMDYDEQNRELACSFTCDTDAGEISGGI